MSFSRWRRYLDGNPEYLAQHYWWAYLAPRGVWLFDHSLVINLILFGQYRRILNEVMRRYEPMQVARTLQLTCAYGSLTPTLANAKNTHELHVMDVAEIQLAATRKKLQAASRPATMARMNAESLAYATNSFDCVIIFFLLHELPVEARERTLSEAIRVLKPDGNLLIAEYAENHGKHLLHRFAPWRWTLEIVEPFLYGFWHSNLHEQINLLANKLGKRLHASPETLLLGGLYRVMQYRA